MKTNTCSLLSILAVIFILNIPQSGAQTTLNDQVDQLFAAWNKPQSPGAAIAIVKDGAVIYKKGYGSANLEYEIPVTPSTVFHVASVSKQVTAFAVLLLAEEGKLSYEDDVRKYIPEVPDFGHKITLRELALHTSGLRDQWHLLSLAGWRLDDVITAEHILKLIHNQKELNFVPGDEHMYSNTGYTLLAEVVARVSGKSFAEFTEEKIFKPLGMNNTLFYDDHEKIVKNRAYSFSFDGQEYKKSVLNYANVGATSLFTTVEDMARWVMNFEKPIVGNKSVVEKMNERGILNNGDTISYALGQDIGIYKGLRFIAHGGADAGYRSFVGRFPDQHFSVIVLSNYASCEPAGLALRVSEIYLKDKLVQEKQVQEAVPVLASSPVFTPDPKVLKTYCGKYQLQPGINVDITAEGSKLFAQAPELPKTELTPLSATEYAVPGMDAKVTFSGSNGAISEMLIQLNGQKMTAPRLLDLELSSINYADYSGEYYSEELNTSYSFAYENGKMMVHHQRISDFDLTPVSKDLFTSGKWFFGSVEFLRNEKNQVTGMSVSGGRIKGLKFVKTGI